MARSRGAGTDAGESQSIVRCMEPSETAQDDAAKGFWSNVPEEITARVMSFLPIPDRCTCRSVCKAWKELLCRPGFLDLCDRKGPSYLFVTSYFSSVSSRWAAGAYQGTMGVFDLEHRRWFSIPLDEIRVNSTDASVPRLLTMDDGLICELTYSFVNNEFKLVMFDLVAQAMWALPALHGAIFSLGYHHPAIVTVVENSNFKVFLLSSRSEGPSQRPFTGFFLYESSTDAWRDLGNPIEELGIMELGVLGNGFAESAVCFHGTFYALYYTYSSTTSPSIAALLLSYNLEEGLWKKKLDVEASLHGNSAFTVFGNRMFMNTWTGELRGATYVERSIFEITEILENSSKSVVRIRREDLKQIFGDDIKQMFGGDDLKQILGDDLLDILDGFAINSDSAVLFSRRTGKLVAYNMTSGCFGELPAHPLIQASSELDDDLIFRAKLMNMSLRNILNLSTLMPTISQATRVK